jgi:hypothetical protein
VDSPLEKAVTSELVSEGKFPASRQNTGKYFESSPTTHPTAAKTDLESKPYQPIPYAA